MQLALPSEKYKKSFLDAVREFKESEIEHASGIALNMKNIDESDFDEYVKRKLDNSKGINLPANYVPATEFWLIDNEEYIGVVDIRHRLNDFLERIGGHIGYAIRPSKRKMGYGSKILELALIEAKKLGIHWVLITCDKNNIGSAKIIQKNGGVLENEIEVGDSKLLKQRYWIHI